MGGAGGEGGSGGHLMARMYDRQYILELVQMLQYPAEEHASPEVAKEPTCTQQVSPAETEFVHCGGSGMLEKEWPHSEPE